MSTDYTCEQHPMRCTRQHKPGANPNRLTHENVLDLTTDKRYPKRVTSYPHKDPGATLWVRSIPMRDRGEVVLVLDEAQVRALGERLLEIADAALVEQALWNARGAEATA